MTCAGVLAGLVLLIGVPPASAAGVSWQEAVARLAQERTQVEACAALLKALGDEPARTRAGATYGAAKAEVDGVIAGLVVALAKRAAPASLPDLTARLDRATAGRDAVCRSAQALLPPDSGAKGAIGEIVGAVLGPLIDAVKEIYLAAQERDELSRKTIQTQVEATAWPAFSAIPPARF